MGALVIPQRYSMFTGNYAMCKRIGVKFNGVDMGKTVTSYNVKEGWVRLTDRTIKHGVVEPYWRDAP